MKSTMLSKGFKSESSKVNTSTTDEVMSSIVAHLQDKIDARRKEKEIFVASMKKITGGKGFVLKNSK
ncbi:MAG: hypothetical protein ACRC3B_05415 [Bacteroidia bacterium]